MLTRFKLRSLISTILLLYPKIASMPNSSVGQEPDMLRELYVKGGFGYLGEKEQVSCEGEWSSSALLTFHLAKT